MDGHHRDARLGGQLGLRQPQSYTVLLEPQPQHLEDFSI
jgi:hypothetical protein